MTQTVLVKALISYLLVAMTSWVPMKNQTDESAEDAATRYTAIATDIVEAVTDPSEPPLWKGSDGQVKTALLVAGIASLEGGYQKFVDDGTCNKKEYKADRRGSCDGKHAYTIWQIHTMGGLIFDGEGVTSIAYAPEKLKTDPDSVWTGPKLVADRKAAARMALHLMRVSYKRYGSLCQYTGEKYQDTDKCMEKTPKADFRQSRALDYLKKNPFVTPEEPVSSN